MNAQLWIFFQGNFVDSQRGLGYQQKEKTSEGGKIVWLKGREFEHVVILIREFVRTKKADRTFVLSALYLITRLDAYLIKICFTSKLDGIFRNPLGTRDFPSCKDSQKDRCDCHSSELGIYRPSCHHGSRQVPNQLLELLQRF